MDYADLFARQARAMDDLLMHAFRLPPEAFTAPGADGAPSLRDLATDWLETQRRAVHATLQGRPYAPLAPAATGSVASLAQAFGGFRLTFRDALESTFSDDLARRVTWTAPDGATRDVSVDDVLAHLALHGARMMGLFAARLRQLGATPPPTDLLDAPVRPTSGGGSAAARGGDPDDGPDDEEDDGEDDLDDDLDNDEDDDGFEESLDRLGDEGDSAGR